MPGAVTPLDLAILGLLGLGIWRGSRTGAVRQVAAVLGLVAALWAGLLLMSPLGTVLAQLSAVPRELGPLVGFVLVAGAVVAAVGTLGLVGRKTLALFRLGFVDTGLGAALGGARAALWMSLLLLIWGAAVSSGGDRLSPGAAAREASVLYEPVRSVAPAVWRGLRAATPGLAAAVPEQLLPVLPAEESCSDRR